MSYSDRTVTKLPVPWGWEDTLRRRLAAWEAELVRGGPFAHLAPIAIQALRAKLDKKCT